MPLAAGHSFSPQQLPEALFRKYRWQMQLARIGGSLTGHWKQRGAIEITLA